MCIYNVLPNQDEGKVHGTVTKYHLLDEHIGKHFYVAELLCCLLQARSRLIARTATSVLLRSVSWWLTAGCTTERRSRTPASAAASSSPPRPTTRYTSGTRIQCIIIISICTESQDRFYPAPFLVFICRFKDCVLFRCNRSLTYFVCVFTDCTAERNRTCVTSAVRRLLSPAR